MCGAVVMSSGVASPAVRAAVLWAFRYETSDVVSAEECHAVTLFDLDGTDVIAMLTAALFCRGQRHRPGVIDQPLSFIMLAV